MLSGSVAISFPIEALARRCTRKRGETVLTWNENSAQVRKRRKRLIGSKAAPFYQLDGNPKSPSFHEYVGPQNYSGSVVVLNFWTPWCKPCIAEFPYFNKVHQRYSDVQVIGLDIGSFPLQPERIAQFELEYPLLLPTGKVEQPTLVCGVGRGSIHHLKSGQVFEELGEFIATNFYGLKKSIVPYTVIIDKSGRIQEKKTGKFNDEKGLDLLVSRYR